MTTNTLVTRNTPALMVSLPAQQRALERFKLSLGQIREMLEADASVMMTKSHPAWRRNCIVLYSLVDSDFIAVWVAKENNCILWVTRQGNSESSDTPELPTTPEVKAPALAVTLWLYTVGK